MSEQPVRKHGLAGTYKNGCRCDVCRDAIRECNRRYRETHGTKTAAASRKRDLKRKYGLYQWQVDDMIAQQVGCCAICRSALGTGKQVHIDHCYQTGLVRGILCSGCNSGLGKLGDSIEGLRRALAYLEAFEAKLAISATRSTRVRPASAMP